MADDLPKSNEVAKGLLARLKVKAGVDASPTTLEEQFAKLELYQTHLWDCITQISESQFPGARSYTEITDPKMRALVLLNLIVEKQQELLREVYNRLSKS